MEKAQELIEGRGFPSAQTGLRAERWYPTLLSSLIVLGVLAGLLAVQNAAIGKYFTHLSRVTTDFSPTYLRREIASITPAQTIFFGDSVLWGYRLQAEQTAVSILASQGCACRNFAFKKGSPPNYYALARLLQASRVHPKAAILEVNQKVFNQADAAYNTLHPALAALASPFLTSDDRALLAPLKTQGNALAERFDGMASEISLLYAMRSDIRETLYGDTDAEPAKPITSDLLEGTYDLAPLTEKNMGVHYLEKTLALFQASGVPVVAFLTPTNHTLLRDYINTPEYRANGLYLQRLLQRHGARVLDLDAAFPADAFLDEVHLTPPAQRRLASILSGVLPKL